MCGAFGSGMKEITYMSRFTVDRKYTKVRCADEAACKHRSDMNLMKVRLGLL
jgi:hypothetical protein